MFPSYSCRGSSLSSMRTGERLWLVRAVLCFVFWTSREAMFLCWKECLKISHQGRLVQSFFFFFPFAVCFSLMFTLFKYPHNILFFLSFTLGITLFLYLQAFWAPGDTGVVFVGWWHEPFRLGLKYCPNRR